MSTFWCLMTFAMILTGVASSSSWPSCSGEICPDSGVIENWNVHKWSTTTNGHTTSGIVCCSAGTEKDVNMNSMTCLSPQNCDEKDPKPQCVKECPSCNLQNVHISTSKTWTSDCGSDEDARIENIVVASIYKSQWMGDGSSDFTVGVFSRSSASEAWTKLSSSKGSHWGSHADVCYVSPSIRQRKELKVTVTCDNSYYDCYAAVNLRLDCVKTCIGVSCGDYGSCDQGSCTCTDGYSGSACQTPPDPCADVSCGDYGSCNQGNCICTDGYSGSTCQIAPDPCAGVSCGDHGSCNQGNCICTDGYSGSTCQTAPTVSPSPSPDPGPVLVQWFLATPSGVPPCTSVSNVKVCSCCRGIGCSPSIQGTVSDPSATCAETFPACDLSSDSGTSQMSGRSSYVGIYQFSLGDCMSALQDGTYLKFESCDPQSEKWTAGLYTDADCRVPSPTNARLQGDKDTCMQLNSLAHLKLRCVSGPNDSCQYANDGVCDVPQYCNEGTDCDDCGDCSFDDPCIGVTCGDHGTCSKLNGHCNCRDGYSGSTCEILPANPPDDTPSPSPGNSEMNFLLYIGVGVAALGLASALVYFCKARKRQDPLAFAKLNTDS